MAEQKKPVPAARLWLITAVVAVSAAGIIYLLPRPSVVPWWAVALFLALNLFIEVFSVNMPFTEGAGTQSVGAVAYLAELMIFGPVVAALLATVGSIRPRDLSGKVGLRPFLFNRAVMLCSMGAAGQVFLALGGQVMPAHPTQDLIPVISAGLMSSLVNVVLLQVYLSTALSRSLKSVWRNDLSFAWANYLGDAVMGFLLSVLYEGTGALGILLFLVPVLFARWTMARFVENRKTFVDGVHALLEVIRLKDPETAEHSERVADLLVQMGERMNLRPKEIDQLYFVGLLHDVGKLGVPDEILKKPSSLDIGEYMVMKNHSKFGEQVIKNLSYLGDAFRWVGAHHERWDGAGFPDRMKDVEIPFAARILSVVDSYDAITENRRYRRGSTDDRAFEELANGAGTQFDAMVVDQFVKFKRRKLKPDQQARLHAAIKQAKERKRELNVR